MCISVLQLSCYYSLTKCRLSCQSLQWEEVSTPVWGHLVWRTQSLPGLCLPGHWSNFDNCRNHPAPCTSLLFTVVRKQYIQVLWAQSVCTLSFHQACGYHTKESRPIHMYMCLCFCMIQPYLGGLISSSSLLYCPGQAPILVQGPTPNFDSSVVCEVLRVTAHHPKFSHGEFELTQTVSMSFRCHYIQQQGLHTPVVASSVAFFTCSTKFAYSKWQTLWSPVNQVGPFSSSFLYFCGWPCLPK